MSSEIVTLPSIHFTMPPISSKVKINVDLGEGYGNFKAGPDDELIPLIDYANVACGGHAGDPMIMHQTVKACKAHNIAIGAHPGLPDIQGFGRRYIRYDPEELTAIVRYQVGALKAFLDVEGVKLHHVKPHGTLYGMCYQDVDVCRAVYAAIPNLRCIKSNLKIINKIIICEIRFRYRNQIEKNKLKIYLDMNQSST